MIIIDAGHGGSDPGATAFGVREKDWTLDVSLYQYRRLKELGIPVKLTREKDVTVKPDKRSSIIRNSGAAYCISNHFNAGGGTGCETIHSIHSNGKFATEIAKAIAREGMPFRRVFSRKGTDGRDYYYMHRLTGKVQTIIVEYGFLDNEKDFKRLNSRGKRERYAEAVVQAICKWTATPYKENVSKKDVLYRVQVGAFHDKQNANSMLEKLKKDGYQGYIVK